MRGLIILEGPDGAGKSTLAQIIMHRIGEIGGVGHLYHYGKPATGLAWERDATTLLEHLREAFTGEGSVVILDRHFIGEAIYGDVYRKGSEYPTASRHLDRLLHRFRALRVLCAPPVDYVKTTFERLKTDRQEMYADGMEDVAKRYLNLWQALPLNGARGSVASFITDYVRQLVYTGGVHDTLGWYHYDVTTHGNDMKMYASFLLQELESEQDLIPEEMLDITEWSFTGFPSQQSVLLVADKLAGPNLLSIPFYSNQGSSRYLAETLQKINADEAEIVIANVNDPGGLETVRGLSEMCGPVVAMGREAEKTMRLHGLRIDQRVRHPQHARRFSYKDDTYADELRDALAGWAGVR